MTDLRQAAQAVLERWDSPAWKWHDQGPTSNVIDALREVLEQPEQEPVAPDDESICDDWISASDSDGIAYDGPSFECGYKIGRIAERDAQPEQEPVAWLSRDEARLALWDAIHKREFGNPTDDKLILNALRDKGLWIGRLNASLERAAPEHPEQEPVAWMPVTETLPKSGVKVLACYRNRLGNLRRIRAMWTAAKTEEADGDAEACIEYDEAADTYYVT